MDFWALSAYLAQYDNQASNYGHYTDTDVGDANANNLGYVVRRNFSRSGGNQTLHIPLSQMFGFTRDLDMVNRGIKWQMILHKNPCRPSSIVS